MAKTSKIRWRAQDDLELRKAVRNHNDKIRRLERKYEKIEDAAERKMMINSLPERVSYAELRKGITDEYGKKQGPIIQTRAGFKQEIESLKAFTKRGAEQVIEIPDNDRGVLITQYQYEDMLKREKKINRERKKRRKEVEASDVTRRGEKTGYQRKDIGMGKQQEQDLKPVNAFTPSQKKADIRKKARTLRKESQPGYWEAKDIAWRDNYTKTLLEELGDVPEVREIIDFINSQPIESYKSVMYSEEGIKEYSYPLTEEQRKQAINELRSIWMRNADLIN